MLVRSEDRFGKVFACVLRVRVLRVRCVSVTARISVDVTLDPDTVHPQLILSADGKQVTCGDTPQDLPDTPQRFNVLCVLGKQSFSSGRFYYEVQVRGKTDWTLGVVRENVNRKEWITLKPQNGLWTVVLWNENQYEACAGPDVPLTLREKVEVVGVFVDYEEGLVSFYDVKSRSHIYSFTGQSFTEKLYPYFSPWYNVGVSMYVCFDCLSVCACFESVLYEHLVVIVMLHQAELLEVMEEKQKAAERQAELLIKELEQEIKVLKRRDTELEQLSHTEEHLHLLQINFSAQIQHDKKVKFIV
ncbi:hypothetical protein QTP70_001624 [Hemibagrus guttatus]|uniref:B30.2/SPRY domain-containing protein n=1 Tax=Hemibagrus guttatus TaxID=175788 RepID=A0AAE0R6L9_9TELE|nr:hypothetical protein QTP70_001624 [Hemibagrus guttatus]